MAIIDKTKSNVVIDRDKRVSIGIDMPFRLTANTASGSGYFASTFTTIDAVKNNIRLLLDTDQGERLMQPTLGVGLKTLLFDNITQETTSQVQLSITDTINTFLPFVTITKMDIEVEDNKGLGPNSIYINLAFNINKDPSTHDSVQVTIQGG